MSLDSALLEILVCPEDKTPVRLAPDNIVESLNQRIAQGSLKNREGKAISEKIQAGLIRVDGKFLYPVREDIPIMLIEEAIGLD